MEPTITPVRDDVPTDKLRASLEAFRAAHIRATRANAQALAASLAKTIKTIETELAWREHYTDEQQ